ncbi:hypothetical protein AgCh_000250 [Apium graveolens]
MQIYFSRPIIIETLIIFSLNKELWKRIQLGWRMRSSRLPLETFTSVTCTLINTSNWATWATWVLADSNTAVTSDNTTLFEPVRLSDDTIALRDVANNAFCKRLTEGKSVNCLVVAVPSVTGEARFKVVELVSSRTISNYDFHLMNARIYNEAFDTMSENSYPNTTSVPVMHRYSLRRLQRITTTWSSSISMRLSVKASARIGIPIIVKAKVTIGAERDVLYTGETVITVMDDGIFTGANFYSFKVQSFQEPLVKNLDNIEAEPEQKTVAILSLITPGGGVAPLMPCLDPSPLWRCRCGGVPTK